MSSISGCEGMCTSDFCTHVSQVADEALGRDEHISNVYKYSSLLCDLEDCADVLQFFGLNWSSVCRAIVTVFVGLVGFSTCKVELGP